MRRALLVAVVVALAFAAASCRAISSPMYGVTVDNASGASQSTLNAQAAALTALPHMPTVRVVLDGGTHPDDYQDAFEKFQPIAYTMAELLDSSELDGLNVTQYAARATEFVEAFTVTDPEGVDLVDIFEVGNEVNGNWTGDYQDVADKITVAYQVVRAHQKRSALTLWENSYGSNHCGNGASELTPVQFSEQYLAPDVRADLAYVFLSWYPTQCSGKPNGNSNLIPAATIKAEVEQLRVLYPHAKIGFGELGLPNPVTSGTLATAQAIATYYYELGNLGLSYYVGAYFWWYFAQDAVPTSKPMWSTLADAMQ